LVVAPHADDELLGCGGTLLRLIRAHGARAHWLIVTSISETHGHSVERSAERRAEVAAVARAAGFASVYELGFAPAGLDRVAQGDLVAAISKVVREIAPNTVFLPFRGDAHSDHRIVFDAAAACTKWFRYPSVKHVLAYETISETDFGLDPDTRSFNPNIWVDTSDYHAEKLALLDHYPSEIGEFPFPRSKQAITAQAQLRGSQAGVAAAEAFVLLKSIY
jgi:LmbE family N-acetylglucosaminyl deacetylase